MLRCKKSSAVIASPEQGQGEKIESEQSLSLLASPTTPGALDTRALLKREVIFKLGQIFRDALRYHLSEEFPYFQFPIVPIKNGLSFDIAGIPEALSKAFSNRRSRIEEGLKELEKPSSRQVQRIVLETRPVKPKNISSEALFERWQAVGRTHGFHADAFEAISREKYLLAQTFKASMLHLQTPAVQTFKPSLRSSEIPHGTPTRKSPEKNHFRLLTAPQRLRSPEKRRSLIQTLKDIMTPEWLRPISDVDAELRRARICAAKRQERFQKKITRLYWQGRVPLTTYLRCVKGIGEPRRKWAIELKFFLGQMNLAQRLYLWSKHKHGIPTIGVPRSRALINLYAAAGKISRTQQIILLERNGHLSGHKHSHRY
jgi:TrwC relaxase